MLFTEMLNMFYINKILLRTYYIPQSIKNKWDPDLTCEAQVANREE